MIGTIREKEGLIPSGTNKRVSISKVNNIRSISTKEYGASYILNSMSLDIIERLKESFPQCWQELWALALGRILYKAPLKNMHFLYQESYLSEQYPDLRLSKNHLTELLHTIGEDRKPITDFMIKFIDGSEHLVFDTSNVISQSNGVKMSSIGYNSQGNFNPQLNLFYVFSTDKEEPVYYRLFPGNISGISALTLCIKEAGIKNAITIGDKGFYSQKNIEALENANLKYILPLKRDNKCISYERLKSRDYDEAFEGHFFYRDRAIFYYSISNSTNNKIIVFYDKSLSLEEDNTYLKRVSDRIDGYSMENYKEKQFSFGTIAMITNIKDCEPQKIYESYKSRMEIETVFDTYKNLLEADRTYMQSDSSMQAWMFINHLSLLLYYKIFRDLKNTQLLSSISPSDILMRLSRINKVRINNQWMLAEINSKTLKMMKKLGWLIT